ncbi:MAG TPA: phospholipase D-like domain-containing anti-phage protein [Edaphobacter sp.]|uniref:phospholipase D-like domain-containing anti-phage protein n=1 Tax=Edaphobacter sp. TaxID=1934404 RepID=UPI002C2AAAFB|nr:phospholipase D-like domain-containing anti-phage protein [Edaphobacter sp.]HUZ94749.1 phospholipase D-like domain-containing anti-phage protein [Edaphobacter sp.]
MTEIRRFSSRRERLDHAFLSARLKEAQSYKRIAGYFRSSIFELVGEEIAAVPKVQIVCNSELDAADVVVSKHVRETALKERWNEAPSEVEALLHRERYRRLYDLLASGRVEIRVVPKDRVFVHGKAGVIEGADGSKTCFLGSINETRSAFAQNYEILWEDTSEEGVTWVEEEFEALWKDAYPLPDAIIEEIKRVADRVEIRFEEATLEELPAAALAESPIYRGGEQLQPWQRSFVTMFLQHRETYGKARLLLADEVGVGKTLSLAASAMISALLDDGPVLILCPSTLTVQWQVEMMDKLGIPSAVWSSTKKEWIDPKGHIVKTRGPEDIKRCPFRIAIVSTGLIVHDSEERRYLLECKYGSVVLDEAHKARRHGGLGPKKEEPNNLLDFMLRIGPRTRNLLLGTATPIQTEVRELWDLLRILNAGADFVLGRELFGRWPEWERALPVVKGEETPADEKDVWEWLRNPLPPAREDALFATLRLQLGLPDQTFFTDRGFGSLGFLEQQAVAQALAPGFLREHNPIVRHTVLRRRQTLENTGLLERVGVDIHPDPDTSAAAYAGVGFSGLGLLTNLPFDLAYQAAEAFTAALKKRTKAAGFMKTLLLQRICSSFASGRSTAERMLRREVLDDEEQAKDIEEALSALTPDEAGYLRTIAAELARPEARDPKLAAVRYFLTEHRTEGKTWLEHGCIVFSQYYDTVYSLGAELAKLLPGEPVGVYAGAGKSGMFRGDDFASVGRDEIKNSVKKREIRLVVATDAACEGLNLQTLGTLINVDLPWNPARLEQRLGRIKRFGQARRTVDMLNLVYHDTQDEKVYQVLSRRMKDRYDILGGLPDTIEDDWTESVEKLEEMMDEYIHLRQKAHDVFEMRYQESIDPDKDRWELCSKVLARRDVVDRLSAPW